MTPGAVNWRSFTPEAFEEAAARSQPILLSLTATWSRRCTQMDEEVYTKPPIAAQIANEFVPVRADVDRRPRIQARYAMGGVPSTVFLNPTGDLLTGAGYLSAESIGSVLTRVSELWTEKGPGAGRVPRTVRTEPPRGEPTEQAARHLTDRLKETFDPDHGGWGTGQKFPHPAAIKFALTRIPDLATRTLDPIRQHLTDTYDGGFFRYARNRDWSNPHRAKLTSGNAALLDAFAAAYLHTEDEAYRETATEAARYLTTTLWTGSGVAGSQAPAPPHYYHLSPSDREARTAPPIDPTIYAARCALATTALLRYSASTEDTAIRGYGERALAYLNDELVQHGVVRHYESDEAPTGLLLDHARVMEAFTTASQIIDPTYYHVAIQVADSALSTLESDHGFLDGPLTGPGLLDRPFYSIDATAAFANALIDLHAFTGASRYHDAAKHAVAAFAGAHDRINPSTAEYATAESRLTDYPRIDVHTPIGSELHRTALRVPDHEKIVVPHPNDCRDTVTVRMNGDQIETSSPASLRRFGRQ